MNLRRHPLAIFLGLTFVSSFLSAESAHASGARFTGTPLPVNLYLRYYHQFQFAGYYAAEKQGFYRNAGIDVKIVEGRPAAYEVDFILEKPGRFGIGNANLVGERGLGKPIVALTPIFQHSPAVLIALESSGIRKPSDLVGKRVGVREARQMTDPAYRGMMLANGISPDRVEWVNHSWNIKDLIEGRLDALSVYLTTEVPRFRQLGHEIRVLNPTDYGMDFYGDVLFTSESTMLVDPTTTRKFVETSLQGWHYALENTEEMIQYIAALPGVKERGITEALLRIEAAEMRKLIEPDLIEIGYSNQWRWDRIIDIYRRLGQIPKDAQFDAFVLRNELHEWGPYGTAIRRILLVLAGIALLAVFWVFSLRAQVARKTLELQNATQRAEEQRIAAERANEIKSLFLANISHELRTPLTAILGFVDLLKNPQITTSDRAQFLSIVERTGENLAAILNDILDLAKIESGKLEIRATEISLDTLIADFKSLLALRADHQGVDLRFVADGPVPDLLVTDGIRLKQILLNVIGNAIKFTTDGDVEVRYGLENGLLVFRVRDTGIGIADEDREKLFHRFSQIDQSFQKGYSGTGLGLTISRQLAQLLGGDLVLESSKVGVGSIFRISIRYQPGARTAKFRETAPRTVNPSAERLRGNRILVVDDCSDNQLLVKLFLEKEGAQVFLANNGEEAVREGLRSRYDLIFMDIQMPLMDGYSATQSLRKNGYTAPILALTANAMKEDLDRCIVAGCDGVLSKPVRREELVAYAERFMSNQCH